MKKIELLEKNTGVQSLSVYELEETNGGNEFTEGLVYGISWLAGAAYDIHQRMKQMHGKTAAQGGFATMADK
jgi:hypothetical protein